MHFVGACLVHAQDVAPTAERQKQKGAQMNCAPMENEPNLRRETAPRRYLTISVPFMPTMKWAGKEQRNT